MDKLIITGANGVGKSHFAAKLASVRPDIPIISFDAIKLKTDWQQKDRAEIVRTLASELKKPAWILEGGPSLLFQAAPQADALIWLDPPEYLRAWQLATRPWKFLGKTRPELPEGNVDWPVQQYKFALRSLKNRSTFRNYICEVFENASDIPTRRCCNAQDRMAVMDDWAKHAGSQQP